MQRRRPSVGMMLLGGALACVLVAVALVWLRVARADIARRELTGLCSALGGTYRVDLVDGYLHLDFTGVRLTSDDAERIRVLRRQCLSTDLEWLPCEFTINLTGATLEGDLFEFLDDRVIGLNLSGWPVEVATVCRIAAVCPRLASLEVDSPLVTDSSLPCLEALPMWDLNVARTSVSADGLRRLCGRQRHLSRIRTSLPQENINSLERDLPGSFERIN